MNCTGCGKEGKSLSFTYITDPDLYCGKCQPEMFKKYCLRYGKKDGCCESLLDKGICPGHTKYLKDKQKVETDPRISRRIPVKSGESSQEFLLPAGSLNDKILSQSQGQHLKPREGVKNK